MKLLESLLLEYGDSHQTMTNKIVHWICVPVIVWSVVALLWLIPFPATWQFEFAPINWAFIGLLLAQIYYFSLSIRLGLGLLLFNLFMLWITALIDMNAITPLWQIAVFAFVAAWIGQFIGHIVERKRPSFFKDLQFLLIGPAWLMAALYRTLGLKY